MIAFSSSLTTLDVLLPTSFGMTLIYFTSVDRLVSFVFSTSGLTTCSSKVTAGDGLSSKLFCRGCLACLSLPESLSFSYFKSTSSSVSLSGVRLPQLHVPGVGPSSLGVYIWWWVFIFSSIWNFLKYSFAWLMLSIISSHSFLCLVSFWICFVIS